MCGIAGIVRIGEAPLPNPDVVPRMISTLVHRGPDQWGDFRNNFVHMAAVRLAVMDVENGKQPALTPSGNTAVVYNGEIYNYRLLAAELKTAGHTVKNESDTIVLPHLYEQYGLDFISKLRGMFAFGLWDRNQNRFILVRDRLGIKPLFFSKTKDYLIFASEIKAILASGLVQPELDRDSLDDLFSFSYPCPPRTMFKNIFELLPAHFLCVDGKHKEIKTNPYWHIPFAAQGEHLKISKKDAAVEYRERLKSVVTQHLMSDVGVATYLSGGIDSSAITALAQEVLDTPLDCFTITFPESLHNEQSRAEQVAKSLNAKHHLVACDASLAEQLPQMVYHMELPLQYPVSLPLQKLSAHVHAAGHKVALTGEGADEQLAGYDCFRLATIKKISSFLGSDFVKAKFYKNLTRWIGSPSGIDTFLLERQRVSDKEIKNNFGGAKPPWFDIWHALDIERNNLLGAANRSVRSIDHSPKEFANLLPHNIQELHPLDAALAIEMKTRLSSWALLTDDRAAMSNGVETRVPFLDHELVEWVASLPPKLKLNGFREKVVLRESMKGLLPNNVRQQKKQSFYSPIGDWFFSPSAPEFVKHFLSDQQISTSGVFESATVKKLQDQFTLSESNSFIRLRYEWVLILILQTELLHSRFVRDIEVLTKTDWRSTMKNMPRFKVEQPN